MVFTPDELSAIFFISCHLERAGHATTSRSRMLIVYTVFHYSKCCPATLWRRLPEDGIHASTNLKQFNIIITIRIRNAFWARSLRGARKNECRPRSKLDPARRLRALAVNLSWPSGRHGLCVSIIGSDPRRFECRWRGWTIKGWAPSQRTLIFCFFGRGRRMWF